MTIVSIVWTVMELKEKKSDKSLINLTSKTNKKKYIVSLHLNYSHNILYVTTGHLKYRTSDNIF